MKVGITSSRYGLYKLGYTFDTMRISVLRPQGLEITVLSVRIAFCNLKRVKMESPVIANQPSCGEQVLEFCTNRPSRSGSRSAIRVPKRLGAVALMTTSGARW